MSDTQPLVTIGVPVYNGGTDLAVALGSLVAQDYPAIEILISDNASTDGTSEFCTEFAKKHPHVRYHRNPVNVGPVPNFLGLLDKPRGKYFMWAAHDDIWPAHYVSTLAALLDARPSAVLATPAVRHVNPHNPARIHTPDRAAPGTSRFDNLRVFLEDDACTWIYGLFRTDWLQAHAASLQDYPTWRGDLTWLVEMLLANDVVGSENVVITKQAGECWYRPQSERERMAGWIRVTRDLTNVCRRTTRGRDRRKALQLAWYYCYRKYLRRGNPIGTAVRMTKVLAMWSYFRLRFGPLVESSVQPAAAGKRPALASEESTSIRRAA